MEGTKKNQAFKTDKANRLKKIQPFDYFNVTWMILFALFCLIPLVLMITVSLSSQDAINKFGYTLFPKEFTLEAYKIIFLEPADLLRAYGVSIIVTGGGTLLNVFLSAMIAYPLSKQNFKMKKYVTVLLLITMLFSPGLVPTYILLSQYLHWKNTFAVMMIPQIGATFYIILLRTFFSDLPGEISESAKLDGCSVFREFISIALPLSKPALATCSVLVALGYWNDWGTPYLYIDDNSLWNVQMLMINLVQQVEAWKKNLGLASGSKSSDAIVMATCVAGTVPVLGVFLYLQKYIVSGLTVGAVKG